VIERIRRTWRPEWSRWLAFAAIAFCIGFTVFILSRQAWTMSDGLEYRQAAERLRDHGQLYVAAEVGERSYRYAPWFAYLWMAVPFPDAVWIGAMTVCAVLAVIPIATTGWLGIALGALVFPYLLIAAMGGHVQPALIAALAWGLGTRWGPIVIAVVASLKLTPIVYVAVFVARRQWVKAAVTVALTAALVAPMLLFDLTDFPAETTGSWGLFEWSPVLWVIVVGVTTTYVVIRPSWLAASVLATLTIPKFVYYDVAYLVTGPRADQLERDPGTVGREGDLDLNHSTVHPTSGGESRAT
jgi:hypothetical protein